MSAARSKRNSGRSAASPRSGYGSWLTSVSQPLSARTPDDDWAVVGNTPSTSPGTTTTSHSSPFAACAVMTCTASGSGSRTGR
ncbi:Uncharacterised protein [Mycobacteroides abscessus]|nr:Uncharacterised protein [Mycobacteroides abscessus]